MRYNKLVRDRIPEVIRKKGDFPKTHIATKKEYWQKLKSKFREEIKEFEKDESMDEMADIMEIVDAIVSYKKFNRKKLLAVQKKKAKERGGFKKRIILEEA